MKHNWIFPYYIYALMVILASGYVVFILGHSGWWFILTLILLDKHPHVKNN